MVTNLAASMGGMTWVRRFRIVRLTAQMLLDWRLERKWSAVGFCSGAIAGLVGITPASGYVGSPAALAIGFLTATACNFATKLKFLCHYDDALDIFATHGIGGMVGSVSLSWPRLTQAATCSPASSPTLASPASTASPSFPAAGSVRSQRV